MKDIKDVAVVIQARLSSQRCPRKMIRPFAGTTLTDLVLEKLTASEVIPRKNIYLAVHEQELIDIGNKHGVNVFERSIQSAQAEGESITTLYEWWDKIPFKYVVMINACVPFLSVETIDGFFRAYLNTDSNGLFGVMEKRNYFWDKKGKCKLIVTGKQLRMEHMH